MTDLKGEMRRVPGASQDMTPKSASADAEPSAARSPQRLADGSFRYGEWRIHYDPPPIPIRTMDWHFVHDNFDASWEGEEDGWVGNGLCGSAASLEACKAEIDELEDERCATSAG